MIRIITGCAAAILGLAVFFALWLVVALCVSLTVNVMLDDWRWSNFTGIALAFGMTSGIANNVFRFGLCHFMGCREVELTIDEQRKSRRDSIPGRIKTSLVVIACASAPLSDPDAGAMLERILKSCLVGAAGVAGMVMGYRIMQWRHRIRLVEPNDLAAS